MKLKIQAGTTNRIVRVFIQDTTKTDGSGLTGLTASSPGLAWYYSRVGDTGSTAVAPAAGTVGTWSSGGFAAVDGANMPGVYEIGLPNAALAAGSTAVHLMLRGATNMAPVPVEIELDAVNYQSNTAFLASVPAVTGTVAANLTQVGGAAVPATSVNGVLKVDVAYLNGAPATASSGALDANLVSVNGATFAGPNAPANTTQWGGTAVGGLPGNGPITVGGYAAGQDPAALMAAAGYTTTRAGNLDAIKAVTDHLGTALAPGSGGNYVLTAAALANSPTGSGGGVSLVQIQGELDARGLTATTTNLVATNLDARVSTRSTYAGGPVASVNAPVTVGTVNDKAGYTVNTVLDKAGYSLAGSGLDAIQVETGVNVRQALSPILAASAGVILGAGTGTIVVKGGNVSTTRITASTDNAGNRTAVTLSLPA